MAHNREKPRRTAKNNFARSQREQQAAARTFSAQREKEEEMEGRKGGGEEGVSESTVWDLKSPFNY